jgi:hypothetical protein
LANSTHEFDGWLKLLPGNQNETFFSGLQPPPHPTPGPPPSPVYLQLVVLALVPLQQNIKIAISLFFMFLNIPHVPFQN